MIVIVVPRHTPRISRFGAILLILIVLVTICVTGCYGFRDAIVTNPIDGTVDWFVCEKRDDACIAACVERDGRLMRAAHNCDEHSIFRIASVSKLMFVLIIRELSDERAIDLEAPITQYYKGYLAEEYRQVALRDLLENRSGLPREFLFGWNPMDLIEVANCGFWGTDIYRTFGERENFEKCLNSWYVRWMIRHRETQYSNVGFALLMMAITDHLGIPIDELVRTRIIDKYGLVDTSFDPQGEMSQRYTRACAGSVPWLKFRGESVPDHRLGEVARATGGIRSSLADVVDIGNAFWPMLENLRLSELNDDEIIGVLKVKVLPCGRRILYRQGMIYGGASFVGFDLQDHRMVVILRNVTSWPSDEGFYLMDRLAVKE